MWGFPKAVVGIDIGSSTTTVVTNRDARMIAEPTYIAYSLRNDGAPVPFQYGSPAKAMDGKAPSSIRVTRPLRAGAIANFDSAAHLISYLVIQLVKQHNFVGRRFNAFACVPESSTNVERRVICQSLMSAGAKSVTLLRKPIVAALGAGIEVRRPVGALIVDIGGGTCEISIISLTDLVISRALKVGGDTMDAEIITYIKRTYNLLIGEGIAEDVKRTIGAAIAMPLDNRLMQVKGRNCINGLPTEVTVSRDEIVRAITPVIDSIADAIRDVLEQAPPDIMSDILESGITVTGGVGRLLGIDTALSARLNLAVSIPDHPERAVARGLTTVLKSKGDYRHIVVESE